MLEGLLLNQSLRADILDAASTLLIHTVYTRCCWLFQAHPREAEPCLWCPFLRIQLR